MRWHGLRLRVRLTRDQIAFEADQRSREATLDSVVLTVRGEEYDVSPGAPVVVALKNQGPVQTRVLDDRPMIGGHRADGTVITAGVPTPSLPADAEELVGGP